MYKYDEIVEIAKQNGIRSNLATFYMVSVLSGNVSNYNDAAIKIVSFGHDTTAQKNGRSVSKDGNVPMTRGEIAVIGRDFLRVHLNSLSLIYSILIQSTMEDIDKVCTRAVEMLFEIGCNVANMNLTDEDGLRIIEEESGKIPSKEQIEAAFGDDEQVSNEKTESFDISSLFDETDQNFLSNL